MDMIDYKMLFDQIKLDFASGAAWWNDNKHKAERLSSELEKDLAKEENLQ